MSPGRRELDQGVRGPCGSREMLWTTSPVSFSFASRATSACETTPTRRSFSPVTARRADLMARHELERVREIVVGMDSHELARRDGGCRHPLWILALRDCAHDDVSVCDDAHKTVFFHDGDRSNVLRLHQLGDLRQSRLRGHCARPTGHHIANFGTHFAPFGVSLVVPGIACAKPWIRRRWAKFLRSRRALAPTCLGGQWLEVSRGARFRRHRSSRVRATSRHYIFGCRQPKMGRAGIEPATLGLRVPCSTS